MKKAGMLGMILATVLTAQSALVVDFDGWTTQTDARSPDISGTNTNIWKFSMTDALIDGGVANNRRIYGGFTMTASGGFSASIIRLTTNNRLQCSLNGTGTNKQVGIFLWNQTDFLAGSSDTVSFDATSSLSMNVRSMTWDDLGARFVIVQDGIVYVSEAVFAVQGASLDNLFTLDYTADSQWYRITVASLNAGTYVLSDTALGPRSFTNVTSVGIYVTTSRTGQNSIFTIDDFQVNATIPEPATIGMLGICGFITLILRRIAK